MSAEFTVLLRVRFAECDAQNVVFNARYGDYVDVAVSEYYRAVFGGYDKLLQQGIDSQVVRLATDWKSSAKYDDVLAISVSVKHVGNSSYSFECVFREHFSRREIATAEITYVMVSPGNHQKMGIPAEFREALGRGMPGKVLDFADVGQITN